MHRVGIKTPRGPPGLPEQTLSKSSKINSNLSSTPIGQILNEMNDLNSKYFELP